MTNPRWASVLRMVVVEDGPREFFAEIQSAGVKVIGCQGGADALIRFGQMTPHAVLLPVRLPDIPTVQVVAAIRREGTQPIMVATEAGDADAVGPALMAGASAAVARPYHSQEVLEWLARALPVLPIRDQLTFGPLTLDPLAHTVRVDHRELGQLPLKEFALLSLLMTHADHVVPVEKIKATLWAGGKEPHTNTVAVHVQRLRRRMPAGIELRTVRGLGYRLTCTGTPCPVGSVDATKLMHDADPEDRWGGKRFSSGAAESRGQHLLT
jgi:DNA-binding response OmpR family regulator